MVKKIDKELRKNIRECCLKLPEVIDDKESLETNIEKINEFISNTGCKVVDSGSNIAIYIADSEEVFSNCKVIDNSRVASPVQIYLDCMQLKGRGEEMAESIFNKEIKK